MAVKKPKEPSLNRSFGYDILDRRTNNETITIIRSHYLKDIRGELLEEEDNKTNNNEIAYITAEVNGIPTKIMIDTGANVSLIDSTELNKIQKENKEIIPTLPVNNIILVGATGRQNKTVKKQVRLEVTNKGITIPTIFLVANSLPFNLLIGYDILRKYAAIIDKSRAKASLSSDCVEWMAELIGSKEAPQDRIIYYVREDKNYRNHTPIEEINYENENDSLWNEKLEEIRRFQSE